MPGGLLGKGIERKWQEGMEMALQTYRYVIVGGGLAGGSAVEGIREMDKDGAILVVGRERHLPYDRPPLSKKLWFGKKTVPEIFVHDRGYYDSNGVSLKLGTGVIGIDPAMRTVETDVGTFGYEKLLIATGGAPRRLTIPGAELDGVCYYRYLDDYEFVRARAAAGKSAVVVGGGFIGSEMAAALRINELDVTMVFPEPYMLQRILPEGLAAAIQSDYINRGVRVLAGDAPTEFQMRGQGFVTTTGNGERLESDILIVGVGISPDTQLAEKAGLALANGIDVNDFLQTSNQDIYAAGDNAFFPYAALGKKMRVEHWDNAINQGKHAGRNMAGAGEPYTYMPYFFSDLFDFGFEAVGEVDSRLQTRADWQKENDTGTIYYLQDGKVRGMMMCNVWEKVDEARKLIQGLGIGG